MQKTLQELQTELDEQISALRDLADSYDGGKTWAAKQIASILYIMLHDGGRKSRSLLTLLGLKRNFQPISSLVFPPTITSGGTIVATQATPMLMVRISNDGASFVPILGNGPYTHQFTKMRFGKWWEQNLFHELSGLSLSRKNLIFAVRHQDGGAHVDDRIQNAHYHQFSRLGDPSLRQIAGGIVLGDASSSGSENMIPNGARALVRQIAWEVDKSLVAHGYAEAVSS